MPEIKVIKGPPSRTVPHPPWLDRIILHRTLASVTQYTTLPRSPLPTSPEPAHHVLKHGQIKGLKLRAHLNHQAAHAARTKTLLEDAALLLSGDLGLMQTEDEMEKTWQVSQDEIVRGAGLEAANGHREWTLDSGPYRS